SSFLLSALFAVFGISNGLNCRMTKDNFRAFSKSVVMYVQNLSLYIKRKRIGARWISNILKGF
ncbi:hypothetical protein ACPV5G_22035, partial [Photobacterium damselae]|uniref:hypothetical protein n=1 Tax=Photobacterium damselae TaxID=38293 RepID=UPI004067BA90